MSLVCLTRQESLVDIIMNYVAFQAITQIDDLYLASEQKMKAKNKMEKHKESVEKRLKYGKKVKAEDWNSLFEKWYY